MSAAKDREWQVAGVFDTETTTVGEGDKARAFTVSWQWNDLRTVNLATYRPEVDDHITVSRSPKAFLAWIDTLVDWGADVGVVPVVTAYNLRFDLQSVLADLAKKYPGMRVNAMNRQTIYTLDLLRDDEIALRFWDTWHLNGNGLAAMGALAGLPKATGSWDYRRVRTPETPLTDEEEFYARRDVQVIPAYLRYVLSTNPWLAPSTLGHTVITSTSLVRRFARANIAPLHPADSARNLSELYSLRCDAEKPRTFEAYAARRACFRGGWTFTCGKLASVAVENVASLDVTSMHHTFMARAVPVNFRPFPPVVMRDMMDMVLETSRDDVLVSYERPFRCAFHGCFRFRNLRLKKGSCFEDWDMATLSAAKALPFPEPFDIGEGQDDRAAAQEAAEIKAGYRDHVKGGVYSFGKIVAAEVADVWLSEVELWIMSRVYQWDSVEPLGGEATMSFRKCPDFIALQSRMLFRQKDEMKQLVRGYREGEPYLSPIGDTVPLTIAEAARNGTLTTHALNGAYYHLKTMFNSIYGTLCENEFKPHFKVKDGELDVDDESVCTPDNFHKRIPKHSRVWFQMGLRVVAGSRLHLVIALELLYERFGERVTALGGDTDSIKLRCDHDVTDDEIMDCLKVLHAAADTCIKRGYQRTQREFAGRFPLDMPDVGHFDIERCGVNADGSDARRWAWHIELWNKARVSIDGAGRAQVTCSGLSRPRNAYSAVDWYEDAARAKGACWSLEHGIGYETYVANDLCHMLARHVPAPKDMFDADVTDYRGVTTHVHEHECVALFDTGKELAAPTTKDTMDTALYLRAHYGRDVLSRGFHAMTANDWRQQ